MSKTKIISLFCAMLSALPVACNRSRSGASQNQGSFDWMIPEKSMAAMANGSESLEQELAKLRSENRLVAQDKAREVTAFLDGKLRVITFVFRLPAGTKPANNVYRRVQDGICMTYLTGIDSGQRQQELTNLGLLADGAEPTSVFVAKEADAKRWYRIEFTVKPDGGCAVTVNYEEAGVTK